MSIDGELLAGSLHLLSCAACRFHTVPHIKEYLPTHVFLNGYKNTGLNRLSLALCEQITSVAFSDILEVAGRVSERKMAEIGYAIKVQYGLAA